MKKGITIRCGAGAAAALAIFAIGALTGQPLLSAACDGFFLAALLLLFYGCIKVLNSDRIKRGGLDLSKTVYQKVQTHAPDPQETASRRRSGLAFIISGGILLLPALALLGAYYLL